MGEGCDVRIPSGCSNSHDSSHGVVQLPRTLPPRLCLSSTADDETISTPELPCSVISARAAYPLVSPHAAKETVPCRGRISTRSSDVSVTTPETRVSTPRSNAGRAYSPPNRSSPASSPQPKIRRRPSIISVLSHSSSTSQNVVNVNARDLRHSFCQLDDFLNGEYADMTEAGVHSPRETSDAAGTEHRTRFQRLAKAKWFLVFFVCLTGYALLVPDLGQAFGNKQSQFNLSISSTVVFGLFLVEVVVYCFGKKNYMFRAHFWLDVLSAISLLPSTYFFQTMFIHDNALAASRTSRGLKALRAAARSTRALRLNRLARLVRVVALVPRLTKLLHFRVKDTDIERALDKRLRKIFQCLDQDADGMIPRTAAIRLLAKVLDANDTREDRKHIIWASRIASRLPQSLSLKSIVSRPKVDRPGDLAADIASDELVDYDEFKDIFTREEWCRNRLRKACIGELRRTDKSDRMTAGHSEHIGVKVALSVLSLLFILSMVQGAHEDHSARNGLMPIDRMVRAQFGNASAGALIPSLVQKMVESWVYPFTGDLATPSTRTLLYLDLNHLVFCNVLIRDGTPCYQDVGQVAAWDIRPSLHKIDQYVASSYVRAEDVVTIKIAPNVNDRNEVSMTDEEFNRETLSFAVVDNSNAVREEAGVSIITTTVVLVCILGGILALSRDMTSLSSNLLKPLQELADDVESIVYLQLAGCGSDKVGDLDPSSAAVTAEKDVGVVSEVRLIRRTFENMKLAIKSWGRYVPWPVVHHMLSTSTEASLEVHEREVTVLFSDIASFTTIVESLPPERSLLLLSRYFNDMSLIMDDHGGIVIEFIGDAILGVFGAPTLDPLHPSQAVRSALLMIRTLHTMNKWFAERGLPEISVRFGIHTGDIVVGNMGFHSRMKYGIVGEGVHLPSKLEELNKTYGTQVLISQTTFDCLWASEAASENSDLMTRPIDIIRLRPHLLQGPEMIYEVVHARMKRRDSNNDVLRSAVEQHVHGFDLYKAQEFEQAAATFRHVNALMMEATKIQDVPSELMMKRCIAYITTPPDLHWDGVWDGPS
eukprot:TRINITY_DN37714_c0_g1_i1.p1 TRINITY_DN37714_c0_g1~~TRINITY_DN37714_c0_g1_i1.p1  ORF type:complete len:1050 (+),score=124.19 TRINITY_DN37714_c0_g1_i1:171-3320(+)